MFDWKQKAFVVFIVLLFAFFFYMNRLKRERERFNTPIPDKLKQGTLETAPSPAPKTP